MTLNSLLKDYMSIQSSEGAVKTLQGAIDRQNSWVTVFKNIQCNIQEKKRADIISTEFAQVGEEHRVFFYHRHNPLYEYDIPEENQTQFRVITHKNPRKLINFPLSNDKNIVIYEFKGHIEQIRHKVRFYLFILATEQNQRQVF